MFHVYTHPTEDPLRWYIATNGAFQERWASVGVDTSCNVGRRFLFDSLAAARRVCDALNSVISSITVE